MTSEKKIAANRRNAQKSTGPRTAAGKAISSRNALKSGAFAKDLSAIAIAEYRILADDLTREFDPKTPYARFHVRNLAHAMWQSGQLARIENLILAVLLAPARKKQNFRMISGQRIRDLDRVSRARESAELRAHRSLDRLLAIRARRERISISSATHGK